MFLPYPGQQMRRCIKKSQSDLKCILLKILYSQLFRLLAWLIVAFQKTNECMKGLPTINPPKYATLSERTITHNLRTLRKLNSCSPQQ